MDAPLFVATSSGHSLPLFFILFGITFVLIFLFPTVAHWRIRDTIPSADDWQRSKIYRSWINALSGTIFNDSGNITWRFDPVRFPQKTDFLVYAADDHEILRIHRPRRFWLKFQVIENGEITGIIRLRSILLNKYTLTLKQGVTWTFRMPLYTVHFRGDSSVGERIWIRMGPRSKRQWNILVRPGFEDAVVLSTIAFIHRRWYL